MNTTSKASNAFEAFFGIHELPPPRVLSSLKASKLHWHDPMANIGIDIIGYMISQQRHGVSTTRKRPTEQQAVPYSDLSSILSLSLSPSSSRHHRYVYPRLVKTHVRITIVDRMRIAAAGVQSFRARIRP